MGYLAQVIAIEEISRASASVELRRALESCVNQIFRNGTEAQKQKYPRNYALETMSAPWPCQSPGLGRTSSACSSKRGEKVTSMLDGNKMWITNGPDADTHASMRRPTQTLPPEELRRLSWSVTRQDFPAHPNSTSSASGFSTRASLRIL